MADPPRQAQLERTPQAPSQARRTMDQWLAGALGRHQLDDVKLLVSELVTNALRHPQDGGGIGLEVAVARFTVRVVVSDDGSGFQKPSGITPPPTDATGGRGLLIVDRVAARWGVEAGRRTAVWFELDR